MVFIIESKCNESCLASVNLLYQNHESKNNEINMNTVCSLDYILKENTIHLKLQQRVGEDGNGSKNFR